MFSRKLQTFWILFALWLMMFSSSSQVIIIAPILPRIGAELGIPETLQGTLITSYALMLSIFALITGPISDKVGRRRILIVGTIAMSAALFLHGIADSYFSLVLVRGIAGVAAGMLSGGAVSYVGDYFPYERRGWANGWVMSGIAFGQIVGIPVGTLLADSYGFRSPFIMFAITMALAAVLIWFVLPQPDVPRNEARLTVRRAITDYARLISQPNIASATVAYFLMFFSVGLYIVYLPTWLERTLHVGGTEIASLFLVGGIVNVVTGPLAGRLSDKVGRKPLIVISCLGLGIVMLATTYLVDGMFFAYVIFGTAMLMVAMRISPLQSLMTALVSADRRGILMALAVSLGQVGVGIGGATAGLAFTHYGYFSNTVIGAISIFLMALIVQRRVPEPELAPITETFRTDESELTPAVAGVCVQTNNPACDRV